MREIRRAGSTERGADWVEETGYDGAKGIADQKDYAAEWESWAAVTAYESAQVLSGTLWKDLALPCSRST